MAEVGTIIAGNINNNNSTNRAVVTKASVYNYIGMSTSYITLEGFTEKWQETNVSSDTLIWGHSSFGTWGLSKWGSSIITTGFYLGLGVLGASTLGESPTTIVTSRVFSYNNTFNEHFMDSEYLNTTETTATISQGRIDF